MTTMPKIHLSPLGFRYFSKMFDPINSRRVNEAVKVFDELENSNSKADIISYNSLINCLGKNGDLDEAHMRFKEM
ncbi:hypothetical protein RJ639_013451 [Escallonia herrerae]|uniref:Pentatricopeptide repeat-containing protein n=1 Tax=Escallonia herrerae TaxID=1293975 RepID=A0AA89AN12_9ASTE|nr:hypothetical protein RJ639_013451 [Escallonia herrerae]